MADIVAKVVEISLPYFVDGVKGQYRYLFRFGSLRDKFIKEVDKLKGVGEDVASHVQTDRNYGRTICPNVEKWLVDVSAILAEADKLKEDVNNKKGCFMGRTCWYPLSKKFEKKTVQIIELGEEGKSFNEVSRPRPQLPIPHVSSSNFLLSETSKAALDQIMEGLEDERTKVIGLYGMGGVGKTTLAEQVIQSVKDSALFDKVTMVVVSQPPNLMAIQDKVAADLGFQFENENDVITKAGPLSLYLGKEEKTLIILDDIWEEIDLQKAGVTFTADQKGCKVLITTRFRRVCSQMNCNKQIHIALMCETDSWELFKKRASLDDASPIIDTAKEVAKECGGLPIAIVPVARALVDNTLDQWKDALQCLLNSDLPGIKNIDDKNAYKCMKLSYDKLNGEELKFCFLMCSLFPEDHEIEAEFLVRYAWGLRICKNADTIEEARIKVQSSIDHLKDYCLLINTNTNKVKLHDVVRHFALWLAFNVEKEFTVGYIWRKAAISKSLETYMAISLIIKGTQELPSGLLCRKLKLLLLSGDGETRVSDAFFKQMEALEVLTLTNCWLESYLRNIPISLRVLSLERCKVGDISSLGGNLKKLEILRFCSSDIRELPDEIGEMKELKVLDLSSCKMLERIPAGLIQKLSCLEELYVTGSKTEIKPWETSVVDNDNSGKASLSELNSLSQLKVLCLDNIAGCLLPDYFVPPNLTRYEISLQPEIDLRFNIIRTFYIHLGNTQQDLLNAIKIFLSTVEQLVMQDYDKTLSIVPEIEFGVFNNLRCLYVEGFREMTFLIDARVQKVPTLAFRNLKHLFLIEMHGLKELCLGQVSNEFLQKLEKVRIESCPKLCSIFQVQEAELREEDTLMLFSTLLWLHLSKLPELICVWKGPTQHINLDRLTYVTIWHCRKLKSIFSLSMARTLVHLKQLWISDCDELEHIFEEEEEEEDGHEEPSTIISNLSFTRLPIVDIRKCNKLKYVFPIFVAPSCLQQLTTLALLENGALEQIFKYGAGYRMEIYLSNLQRLIIERSPKLLNFGEVPCSSLLLPSLEHLEITDCAIEAPPTLEAKKLKRVYLSNVPEEWRKYTLS